MKQYLESSCHIDWKNSEIKELAKTLASNPSTEEEIAKNCFEWVRDNIKHSVDFQLNPVTSKASDVLKYKSGYVMPKVIFWRLYSGPTIFQQDTQKLYFSSVMQDV